MNRKLVLIMALTLLVGMLSVASNVQKTEASGTIYIRADGSVDPPTAPISTLDNVTYTLTGNITSDSHGIVVLRSNIIIEGNGYTLQGSGALLSKGIDPTGRSNVTIKNMNIETFEVGINLISSNNIIVGNNITANNLAGIRFEGSSDNNISGNNIANNVHGIIFDRSSYNSISGNNIANNEFGIYSSSSNNSIYGNSITANNEYGLILVFSSNNISKNNITANSGVGIYLSSSSNNNSISGNSIANNKNGIFLESDSSNNNIVGNDITANNLLGIEVISSNNNSIADNNIANNWRGISLAHSSNNTIAGNNIIANSEYGIIMTYVSGGGESNIIFHNNFVNNTNQVGFPLASTLDVWDNGYPSGGNYWSDYTGIDADGDGIGDTPYIIDPNNQDNYPLMHPWNSLPVHDINTGLGYATIQGAIDANETLNGHTIFAEAGTYYENVVVNKTVTLIGESRKCTVIDGNKTAEAVTIVSNYTSLSGFTVQSSDPLIVAIRLENVSHVTIANNTITNSFSGLVLSLSSSNTITHNNITGNAFRNSFANSSDNILTDNTIDGLSISRSSFNNTLESNMIGSFELSYSPSTKLRNNSISAFGVYGNAYSHFAHDMDSSNTLLGKPVCYWVNREDAEVPSDTGYVALINCMNITVRNLDLGDNYQSIMVFSTNNSRILNNNVTRTNDGIWVISSSNNTISGNNITASSDVGVGLWQASSNTVSGNDITDNGIGIYLYCSSGCNVSGNNVADNNQRGIYLYGSSGNRFFHNNFIGDLQQVYSSQSANAWDDGYPSGGNYWSNYTGVDADWDGMGDTSHIIDVNNTDRYPLIAPITIFDAGAWNGVAYNVNVVSNSTVSGFQFNPSEGALLRFNVTGDDGTSGFCRVTFPKDLLWVEDGWAIHVDGELITDYAIIPDESHTYLYFTYNHSTKTVVIQGTHVIPEFPSTIITSLLMILSMLALTSANRRFRRKPER